MGSFLREKKLPIKEKSSLNFEVDLYWTITLAVSLFPISLIGLNFYKGYSRSADHRKLISFLLFFCYILMIVYFRSSLETESIPILNALIYSNVFPILIIFFVYILFRKI